MKSIDNYFFVKLIRFFGDIISVENGTENEIKRALNFVDDIVERRWRGGRWWVHGGDQWWTVVVVSAVRFFTCFRL